MRPAPLEPPKELRLLLPSPLDPVTDELLRARGVRLLLKRDDLINQDIPGNKWRKLMPNLAAARSARYRRLLTFGGAYSNHLRAVAAAGQYFGFETIGIVRGEPHYPLNEVLAAAVGFGMHLTYLDRVTYRQKDDPAVLGALTSRFGECYILPEGGSNGLAVLGCTDVPREIAVPFDVITCAVGTGGTLAGVSGGLQSGQCAIGFAVLKGADFLVDTVAALQRDAFGQVWPNWTIETGFHFGGYARRTPELSAFVATFEQAQGVRLSLEYEAKMMLGLYQFIARGDFRPGTTIVAVIAG